MEFFYLCHYFAIQTSGNNSNPSTQIKGKNPFHEVNSVAHVKENAVALSLTLTPQELATLNAAYPLPGR